MIFGLPPVSFFIMCILWPAIPIAAVIIAIVQERKDADQKKDNE